MQSESTQCAINSDVEGDICDFDLEFDKIFTRTANFEEERMYFNNMLLRTCIFELKQCKLDFEHNNFEIRNNKTVRRRLFKRRKLCKTKQEFDINEAALNDNKFNTKHRYKLVDAMQKNMEMLCKKKDLILQIRGGDVHECHGGLDCICEIMY